MDCAIALSTDLAAKNLLRQDGVFEQLVHVKCFSGNKDVEIECVREMDPNAAQIRINKEEDLVYRGTRRDLIKEVIFKDDEGCFSMIVGLEPQSYNSQDMVFWTDGYDLAIYERLIQISEYEKRDDPEQEEVFQNEQSLPFVTTIVLWLSADPWPAAKNQRDLIRISKSLTMEIPDHPLNLIEPYALRDEELMEYGPEFGIVLVFIKNSKDEDRLSDVLQNMNHTFRSCVSWRMI